MAYDTVGIGATVTVLAAGAPAAGAVRLEAEPGQCSGGVYGDHVCTTDAECPGGVCARPSSICDGGTDDGLLCDCPGGTCEAAGGCGGDASRGTCRDGRANGLCCDTELACAGNRPCAPSARVCAGGVAKGLPCLNDHHCPGSLCSSPATVCHGGPFDHFACIDDFDCPSGVCAGGPTPLPTPTPAAVGTATTRTRKPNGGPVTTDSADQPSTGGGGGCAVVPTQSSGYEWLLALALIAARYGLRRP